MWQKPIKKTLFTVCVDNYAPEITELTFPFIKRWASKIGADFHVITERKFPHLPPPCEKLQIYRLAQEMQNDWNIFVDADAFIHPEAPDFTVMLPRDTVCHHGRDFAPIRWKYDRYFLRDGRNIGSANWFTIASDWCIDLWKPIDDLTVEEIIANISPVPMETLSNVDAAHLIDDYTLSRNIAKYGFKCTTVIEQHEKMLLTKDHCFFWHHYVLPQDKLQECIKQGIPVSEALKKFKVAELRKIAMHFSKIFPVNTFPVTQLLPTLPEGATEVKVQEWQTKFGKFWCPEGDKAIDSVVEELESQLYGAVNPGEVVIDCGAYVGVFSRLAVKAGASKVVAIEPFPVSAACFERNLLEEIKEDKVTLGKFGVWNEEARIEMSSNPTWATQNSMLIFRGPHTQNVPVTTLDKVVFEELKLKQVDFIKMDIEGAEGMALDGAGETIRKFKPRLAIATEHFVGDSNALRLKIEDIAPGVYGFSNGNNVLKAIPITVELSETTLKERSPIPENYLMPDTFELGVQEGLAKQHPGTDDPSY